MGCSTLIPVGVTTTTTTQRLLHKRKLVGSAELKPTSTLVALIEDALEEFLAHAAVGRLSECGHFELVAVFPRSSGELIAPVP